MSVKFACWILSLDAESDQTQKLITSLKEQGVESSVCPGVDGRSSMPKLEGDEYIDERESIIRHRKLLSPSQVGCYLAHYRAVKKAFDEGYDRICILEDDVFLESNFSSVLNDVVALPDEFEMTRLMALKVRKRKFVRNLPAAEDGSSAVIVRPERGWCGAQGYVLSRPGMKKIVDHGARIFEPIDKVYDHFFEFDLKLYGVEPHILHEYRAESTIKKPAEKSAPLSLMQLIAFHIYKGYRSLGRHIYLRKHRSEFYPCEVPAERMGKTDRLK
jgi:glycosyl transferase family 25